MKLVVIYGPPAVGKLSVAEELEKITSFKTFHNHNANDIINKYLEFDKGNFWHYVEELKKLIYRMAVKENINLITTLCYDYNGDNDNIKRLIKYFRRKGSQVYFVRLDCDKKELFRRVKNGSRKEYGKLTKVKNLKYALEEYEFFKPIPFVKSLTIRNNDLSAKKVAQKIKKELKLKEKPKTL